MKKTIKKRVFAPTLIVLSIIGCIYCLIMAYFNISIQPIDINDSELITVKLESGRLNNIAKQLEEEGIIKDKLAFILRAQLSGTAGKAHRGTFYLSKNMSADKILSILEKGDNDNSTTTSIRISEGDTVEDIATKLYNANVIYDKELFLNLCKTGKGFIGNNKYLYLEEKDSSAKYALEGFLFPDTYEFYFNSKPTDVIEKLLNRFNDLFNADLQAKAAAKGYTVKEVVTLASIIEKEGNHNDFAKVGAVLNNRLAKDMYLQCDSTIRYVVNRTNSMSITSEQFNYDSPYNSYENKGIIPSPICSPSIMAIKAILEPDSDFVNEGYLYFCSTDSSNSSLVFAKTYKEHLENVKAYKDYWEAYDEMVKNN